MEDQVKARYDNYQIFRLALETQEQIELFQELEAESDSYTFYGHARAAPQNLMILVAAHKSYEIRDIISRYNVSFTILVSFSFFQNRTVI
jgi:hypothetical protein